jgi:adhesin/invasin
VASGIGVLSGSAQGVVIGGSLAAPLVVHVTDQYGNAIAGVPVTFTSSSLGLLSSSSATTDNNGNAQTTVSFQTNVGGLDTVTASVSGVTVPARFFERALAGTPVTDSITSGNNQSDTTGTVLPLPLAVRIRDAYGNLGVGDTVNWTASAGTLSAPFSVADTSGTAQVQFTPVAGANTVTASIAGTALTATFTETGN